jgi:FtsP/CotA-like multicopper oxidase with cupredoxin domain
MTDYVVTLHRKTTARGNGRIRRPAEAFYAVARTYAVLLALVMIALLSEGQAKKAPPKGSPNPAPTPVPSQNPVIVSCPPSGQELIMMPEVKSQNGLLRAGIKLTDGLRTVWGDVAVSPGTSTDPRCASQYMRFFEGYDAANPEPWPAGSDPIPGPTLRAHVGDLVEITFQNLVNTQHFANSLDQGEKGLTPGCDQVFASSPYSDWAANTAYKAGDRIMPTKNNPGGYMFRARQGGTSGATEPTFPQAQRDTVTDGTVVWANGGIGPGVPGQIYPSGDVMPNCLHGSSTSNIHFHGTHTTPSTTGDNVLLYIRPAMRSGGSIEPSNAFVKTQFTHIFETCEKDGSPSKWDQLPAAWRNDQEALLKKYDATAPYQGKPGNLPDSMKLWPQNAKEIAAGLWPQYQVGAYPFCFRLPAYESGKVQMGQSPGTHWYHAHKHGSTALNVANGMTGVFIIEGQYDADLVKFYGPVLRKDEKVLMLQQLSTVPFPLLNPTLSIAPGSSRPPISVNGRRNPVISMQPGEVQLWRIVNGAFRDAVRFLYFTPANSTQSCSQSPTTCVNWRQIAQDGVQFIFSNYNSLGKQNNQFNLASANRADLLVQAPAQPGTYVLQASANEGSPLQSNDTSYTFPLLTVNVASGPSLGMGFIQNESDFPQFPKFLNDIPESSIFIRRKVVFGPGNSTIDGESFDPNHINQAMLLNTAEEWTVMNQANDKAHPFHIHINPFQITELFEPNSAEAKDPSNPCYADPLKPQTWKACHPLSPPFVWWDTFAIPPGRNDKLNCTQGSGGNYVCPSPQGGACKANSQGVQQCTVNIPGYFKMRSRFVDFTGQYVLHCHILIHEDRGMMQLVEVVPNTTLYTHH